MMVICLFYVKWLRLFFFCGNISRKSFRFPFVLNDFYDYFLIPYIIIYKFIVFDSTVSQWEPMGEFYCIHWQQIAITDLEFVDVFLFVWWWKMMILVVFVIILSSHISFFRCHYLWDYVLRKRWLSELLWKCLIE